MTEHRLEFTLSENPWAPTKVIAEINERTGSGLELIGLSEQVGGTSSAAFIRWPDGREGAVTRTDTPLDRMHQTARLLETARSRELPVPRHELLIELGDGKVTVVQERLPGRRAEALDTGVVDAMVAMNERFAGLVVDRPDVPRPPAFPDPHDGDHQPWKRTLGQHSERTRNLVERLRAIGGGDHYRMTGDDLVHVDYSPENVLFDGHGRISGVVDWNFGAFRGDRRFALLAIADHLAGENDLDERGRRAVERIDDVLRSVLDPGLLHIYRAHRHVHRVHKSIEHNFRPSRIEADLTAAEKVLEAGGE